MERRLTPCSGAGPTPDLFRTACAVGYFLAPLRACRSSPGWQAEARPTFGAWLLQSRGDGLGLQEQQEVVGATGFGIGAGHVEAAEGVRADHRAGALAVEIQVADVEAVLGFAQVS